MSTNLFQCQDLGLYFVKSTEKNPQNIYVIAVNIIKLTFILENNYEMV